MARLADAQAGRINISLTDVRARQFTPPDSQFTLTDGKIVTMARRKVEEWYWQVGPDLRRLGDELTRARPGVATGKCWEPRADVMDLGDHILIRVELAGVRGEDIGLLYNHERNSLFIRGQRREDGSEDQRLGFYQLEIPYGEFAREIDLPDIPLQDQSMRAQYRNGFLIVVVPKAERIVVQTTVRITDQ